MCSDFSLKKKNGNGTKKYSEKRHLQKKKKKHVWLSGRLHIEGRLNEGPRLQRKHRDENEAKQKKRNTNDVMTSASQTPEGTSSRHLLWLVNKGERTSTSPLALGYPLLGNSGHVRAYHCMPYSSLGFSAAIHFAMKCCAPCSAVLRHSPSSWAAVVHWSALMPKALRSSRKHPIHSFSWPPTQPGPPTISSNITHFGRLVSSMRAANPANEIRLLRKFASMLSLPVLTSVSR